MFTLGPFTVSSQPIIINAQSGNATSQPLIGALVFNASSQTFGTQFAGNSDWLHAYSVMSFPAAGNNYPEITLTPDNNGGEGQVYVTVFQMGDKMPGNVPTTISTSTVNIGGTASVDASGSTIELAAGTAVDVNGNVDVSGSTVSISGTTLVDATGSTLSLEPGTTVDLSAGTVVEVSNDVNVTPTGTIAVEGVAGGTAIGVAGTVDIASGATVAIAGTPSVQVEGGTVDLAAGTKVDVTGTVAVDGPVALASGTNVELASGTTVGVVNPTSSAAPPDAPTVTVEGATGSGTWSYALSSSSSAGETALGLSTKVVNGAQSLSGTDYNLVGSPTPGSGDSFNVYRTGSPGGYGLGSLGESAFFSELYESLVLSDSPVAYWPLTDSAGSTTAVNLVGSGNGTVNGGVTFGEPGVVVAFPDETAALFDGSSGYISTVNPPDLQTSAATFEVWVWIPVNTGSHGVVCGVYPNIGIDINSTSSPIGVSPWLGGSAGLYGDLSLEQWHHVVVVYEGKGSGSRTVYIDSVNVGTETDGTVGDVVEPLYIGDDPRFTAYPTAFNGDIAQVAVYGTALTAAQVLAHYNAGTSANAKLPSNASAGYYVFDTGQYAGRTTPEAVQVSTNGSVVGLAAGSEVTVNGKVEIAAGTAVIGTVELAGGSNVEISSGTVDIGTVSGNIGIVNPSNGSMEFLTTTQAGTSIQFGCPEFTGDASYSDGATLVCGIEGSSSTLEKLLVVSASFKVQNNGGAQTYTWSLQTGSGYGTVTGGEILSGDQTQSWTVLASGSFQVGAVTGEDQAVDKSLGSYLQNTDIAFFVSTGTGGDFGSTSQLGPISGALTQTP